MEAFGKDLRQELQTAINTGFNRLLPRQGNTEMMLLLTALTLFLVRPVGGTHPSKIASKPGLFLAKRAP